MNKVLNLLGLARRAGKVILGTDSVIKIIGISDLGFAKALKKEIERGDF